MLSHRALLPWGLSTIVLALLLVFQAHNNNNSDKITAAVMADDPNFSSHDDNSQQVEEIGPFTTDNSKEEGQWLIWRYDVKSLILKVVEAERSGYSWMVSYPLPSCVIMDPLDDNNTYLPDVKTDGSVGAFRIHQFQFSRSSHPCSSSSSSGDRIRLELRRVGESPSLPALNEITIFQDAVNSQGEQVEHLPFNGGSNGSFPFLWDDTATSFTLMARESPGTGYMWMISKQTPPPLCITVHPVTSEDDDHTTTTSEVSDGRHLIGGASRCRVFRFSKPSSRNISDTSSDVDSGVGGGCNEGQIVLEWRRPWESPSIVAERKAVVYLHRRGGRNVVATAV
eukprot:GHVS01094241.1.p1 GENE.GHVS01094241.1~~GHVS01094241.1.p1  ORF type:complete len:339 (+),score=80.56 GHVS01094241.1:389-1405(+)